MQDPSECWFPFKFVFFSRKIVKNETKLHAITNKMAGELFEFASLDCICLTKCSFHSFARNCGIYSHGVRKCSVFHSLPPSDVWQKTSKQLKMAKPLSQQNTCFSDHMFGTSVIKLTLKVQQALFFFYCNYNTCCVTSHSGPHQQIDWGIYNSCWATEVLH